MEKIIFSIAPCRKPVNSMKNPAIFTISATIDNNETFIAVNCHVFFSLLRKL